MQRLTRCEFSGCQAFQAERICVECGLFMRGCCLKYVKNVAVTVSVKALMVLSMPYVGLAPRKQHEECSDSGLR